MKIGAIVESFRKPFAEAVREAARLGVDGVQMYANTETVNADMTASGIKEVRRILDGEGIAVSALCGDFGCGMFYTGERKLIDREKRVLEIAKELGTNIVTTHIGVVPETQNCAQYESMYKVCKELADFADSIDGHFAVETGPEKADLLKSFLDGLQSKGVGVNLDPANLVMCAGDDPVRAVYTLQDYIVHTHAKDGLQLIATDCKALYAAQYYGLKSLPNHEYYREMPLGEGGVKWNEYLAALKDIGFDGYLTIERECGDTPAKDIALAVQFLKERI